MSLKDKVQKKRESTIGRGLGIYRYVYDEEDVKEAVLEYENYIKDLREAIINNFETNNKIHNYLLTLETNRLKKLREVFGDFENE